MTGQIPKYGDNFRLEHTGYDHDYSHSVYVLKSDEQWFIRSRKGSKSWRVYYTEPPSKMSGNGRFDPVFATAVSPVKISLSVAMEILITGAELGYYDAKR